MGYDTMESQCKEGSWTGERADTMKVFDTAMCFDVESCMAVNVCK